VQEGNVWERTCARFYYFFSVSRMVTIQATTTLVIVNRKEGAGIHEPGPGMDGAGNRSSRQEHQVTALIAKGAARAGNVADSCIMPAYSRYNFVTSMLPGLPGMQISWGLYGDNDLLKALADEAPRAVTVSVMPWSAAGCPSSVAGALFPRRTDLSCRALPAKPGTSGPHSFRAGHDSGLPMKN